MTISYMGDIQSSKHCGNFFRVIFRWRGSVWKCVLGDLLLWLFAYYIVLTVYRFVLHPSGQNTFESLSNYANKTDQYIPLSLLLGFFVKVVLDRWQGMFDHIGFIDKVAHTVSSAIRGTDPDTVTQRRNIVRYLCLVQLLVLRDISLPVRKRFPSLQAIIDAGILHAHELRLINAASSVRSNANFGIHWVPFQWACELCQRARQTGHICGDPILAFLFSQLMQYRDHLQKLLNYDWVPIPVAYPQVVFCAVRFYFFVCLFSRQSLLSDEIHHTDNAKPFFKPYFPLMTMVQFIFYMGWVKVAEELLNPLGEDDDDFETLFVLQRNLHISIALADKHHDQVPEQYRDSLDKRRHGESGAKTTLSLIGSAVLLLPGHQIETEDKAKIAKENQMDVNC